jgi:cytochrome c oxidase assembly factor CtaG
MTTQELLRSAWDTRPFVPMLAVAALGAYAVVFRRVLGPRAAFFVLAVGIFFLALASPIGVLARGYLFSAHMLQHLLLLLAVPPLVLFSLPRETSPPGEPKEWTFRAALLPWLAGVGAMWFWHARPLCNAAAASTAVQWVQTASLIAMGLAFWQPVLAPRRADRLPGLAGVVYLFAACVACTILGVLVTFAPVEVCPAYLHPVDSLGILPLVRNGWGMSCEADQELGGLLMWVPTCLVYAAAILATLGRYYGEESRVDAATGDAR